MTTHNQLANRINALEQENTELRAEVELWRSRAKKKEDILARYQKEIARR